MIMVISYIQLYVIITVIITETTKIIIIVVMMMIMCQLITCSKMYC